MKLKEPVVEETPESSVSERAESLAKDVANLEKKRKLEEQLKPTAEKIIEQILLGERKPTTGMELNIEIKGVFSIFSSKSTEDSFFRYTYPPKNGEAEPQETPESSEDEESETEELDVPII